jgi:ABC-type uncharacterized transport system auxiliary subunit
MNKPITGLLLVLFMFLASCAKEVPPIQYYRIGMETPQVQTTAFPVYESLKVTVRGANNSIYYADETYGKNPFQFSRWSTSPNDMLMDKLVNAIQKSGLSTHVLSSISSGAAQYLLEIGIQDLSLHMQQETAEGKVALWASLLKTKDGHVLKSSGFECGIPVKGPVNAQGAVSAINQALDVCTLRLVAWLQE